MSVQRLSGAFVTRFYEEWKHSGDTMLHCQFGDVTHGEKHQRVERFMAAMGLIPPSDQAVPLDERLSTMFPKR